MTNYIQFHCRADDDKEPAFVEMVKALREKGYKDRWIAGWVGKQIQGWDETDDQQIDMPAGVMRHWLERIIESKLRAILPDLIGEALQGVQFAAPLTADSVQGGNVDDGIRRLIGWTMTNDDDDSAMEQFEWPND